MDYQSNDRRQEYRLTDPATVFVEVRSASADGSTPAEIVAGSGVDLSANGLQLLLDRPLPEGAILRLGADFGQSTPKLYVIGEVRWSRQEADGFRVGFSLFDSDGSDIVDWKQKIASRLSD